MTSAMLDALPTMTVAEFMDWDSTGHIGKLELVNGEVRAMSPASGTHSLIQANLAFLIGAHLRATKRPCRVGTEAPIVPRFAANDNVRAPDLAVTCAPPTKDKTFPDPVLIVEVMSPGNRRETWESILACSTIPSLTEVLIIESEKVRVEIYRRDGDGGWPKDPNGVETDLAAIVSLESIGADLALADIYAGTHLV